MVLICSGTRQACVLCLLKRLQLSDILYSIDPSRLPLKSLNSLNTCQQRDAEELFLEFLDGGMGVAMRSLFRGNSTTTLYCGRKDCDHSWLAHGDYHGGQFGSAGGQVDVIKLSIDDKETVVEAMEAYHSKQALHGGSTHECGKCKRPLMQEQQQARSTSHGSLLALQLKRFGVKTVAKTRTTFKDAHDVSFESTFKHCGHQYKLYAVLRHIGRDLHGGHWIVDVSRDAGWFSFDSQLNTNNVSKIKEKAALCPEGATILLYQQEGIEKECMHDFFILFSW